MPGGRPSDYDFELCKEICDKIADGKHVVQVLDSDERYPTWSTFRRWKQQNPELQTLYTNSIQDKAEMLIYEIIQTMEDIKQGKLDAIQGRVIIDTYKWMAAKFYPKMFGDRNTTELVGKDGEKLPSPVIVIQKND